MRFIFGQLFSETFMRWNCCGRRSTRRTMSEGSISDDSYTPNESSLTSNTLNPEVPRESDVLVVEAIRKPEQELEDESETITDSADENQIVTECSILSLDEYDEMDPIASESLSSEMLEDQVRELQTQMADWNDENGPSMFHNHQSTSTVSPLYHMQPRCLILYNHVIVDPISDEEPCKSV